MPGLSTTQKQSTHSLHQEKTKEQHQSEPQAELVSDDKDQYTISKNVKGGTRLACKRHDSGDTIFPVMIDNLSLTDRIHEQISEEHRAFMVKKDLLVNNFEKLEILDFVPSTVRILEILQQLWVRYDPTNERSHNELIEALGAYLEVGGGRLRLGKFTITSPRRREKTCEIHVGPLYHGSLNASHVQHRMQVVRIITLFIDKQFPRTPKFDYVSSSGADLSLAPSSNSIWQQPAVIVGRMMVNAEPTKWVIVLGEDRILYALWASEVDKRELGRWSILDDDDYYLFYGSDPEYYSDDDEKEDTSVDSENPNRGWTTAGQPQCIVKRLGCISDLTESGLEGFNFKDGGVDQVTYWESELAPLH